MPVPVMIGIATAIAVGLLTMAVFNTVAAAVTTKKPSRDSPPLPGEGSGVRERELAGSPVIRLLNPAVERVTGLVTRFTPTSVADRLDEMLMHAGSPVGWTGDRLLAFKFIVPASLATFVILVGFATGSSAKAIAGFTFMVVAAGYYAPEWIMRSRAETRMASINRALPDAMDMLSITISAGLSFEYALDKVSDQVGGPTGQEFRRTIREIRLGKSRRDALHDMGKRSGVEDLESFVNALKSASRSGTPIAQVLKTQSADLRLRREQQAEELAMKLPVKIILPLILCIFPMIFLVLLGPAAIRIYNTLISGNGAF